MSRKAQNWSLEVIIALSVFLVIFVLVSVFLFYIPEDPTRDLQFQSQKVGSTLENDILVDDDVVIVDNIEELTGYSCDELKDLFAISSDVCIHFEDLDGQLIEVNGQAGIGCGNITFENGALCGN